MKFYQYGRSMVEMLGVLAIIGVLSVGAISGYSKAMTKYRLNKQTEQISSLINTINYYGAAELKISDGSNSFYSLIPFLKKLNQIPDGMSSNDDIFIYDLLNTRYRIHHHFSTTQTGQNDSIKIMAEPNQSTSPLDSCINIASTVKEMRNIIERFTVNFSSGSSSLSEYFYGDSKCNQNQKCLKDLTLSQMENSCNLCLANPKCYLYVIWE